ncbi:MAG: SurA N-terminal domain-containing protein [Agarilytica sp.]
MLLNIRENLKGTVVAGVVLLLFVVPLVLTGVGGSFLGSAAGTNAASVDGKNISETDLRRAIYQRKQQLLSQENVDANAEFLKDENLRGPVLEGLTQRAAIVVSAKNGGMGVSEKTILDTIREIPDFTIDGKFDNQTYQRLLSSLGYTPASFKMQLQEDLLAAQHRQGIQASAFSTDQEIDALVSLTQQKRSFFTVKVPKSLVEKDVSVSDEEIAAHYAEQKSSFIDEEKLSVQYLELSTDEISSTIEISEDDVKAQFEQELAEFKTSAEYEIAHILVEEKDNQADQIKALTQKLSADVDFAELVAKYSDDSGSKDNGGNLGVLTKGIFPEAFEQAVYALEEGQVSEAVITDAGTHFIKVISKKVEEAPTFESRKTAIENALKLAEAEQIFADNLDQLGELTFSSSDLQAAVDALNLKIKTTPAFTRDRGVGVANNAEFREVAYSEEVLNKGYNSRVIELSNNKAIVLRKKEHHPERIKDMEEVKASIAKTLTKKKMDESLTAIVDGLIEKLKAGESPDAIAKAESYEYKTYDKVARTSSDASFQVNSKAFAMSLAENSVVYDFVADRDGNYTVIGLDEVIAGSRKDIKDQQYKGLATQLVIQSSRFENTNYEGQVVADADIDIN